MNKKELIDAIAARVDTKLGLTKADIASVLEAQGDAIRDHLKPDGETGAEATLVGLGKLKLNYREARPGRNPRTSEAITIPATWTVKFSASAELENSVNGGE